MTSINNPTVEAKVEPDAKGEAGPVDFDDDTSCTTLSAIEGSDEEWVAEGIIAEGKVDGETRYLVEWTGYPIKDATWEPRDHVEGVLLEQWTEHKRLQKQGKAERFDLSRWTAGWVQELQSKYERHERRNKARVRMGKPPSNWPTSLEDNIKQTSEYYPTTESRDFDSSSDEDISWDKLDNPAGVLPGKQSKRPASRLQPPDAPQPAMTQVNQPKQAESITDEGGRAQMSTKPSKAATTVVKAMAAKQARPPSAVAAPKSKPSTAVQLPRANGVRQMLAGTKSIKGRTTAVKSGASRLSSIGASAKIPTPAARPNVFIDGKKDRSRPNLYAASSDPTRSPQLLKYRHVRKLELQRRDKENAAPPQMPRTLFSLDPRQRQAGGDEGVNTLDSIAARSAPSVLPNDTVTATLDDTSIKSKKKKKKAVVFDEGRNSYHEPAEVCEESIEMTPESMTLDSDKRATSRELDPFLKEREDEVPVPMEPARPPTPPRSTGKPLNQLDSASSQPTSQDIGKICLLGPKGRLMNLVFKFAPEFSHPWMSVFKSCDRIVFSHVCAAHDFIQMWSVGGHARQYDLASGYISCPTESIEHVVDRLRLNSQGIISCGEGYRILCYPDRCDEWASITLSDMRDDLHALRFVVFVPTANLSAFFAPIPQRAIDEESRDDRKENLITRGLTKFLMLNYAKLIPSAMQDSKEHRFFLAFPLTGSYAEEMQFMAQWLKSSSTATCSIYSGETPGAWRDFVDHGTAGNGGVVILHEDAMWQVRLFPNMFSILESGKFPVYVFTRGLEEDRLFPSSYPVQARPALLNFDQVFWPGTKAFLLTPSFILSRPCEAAAFTRWFRDKYDRHDDDDVIGGPGRLAVCAGFTDWLSDLVTEQSSNQFRKPLREEIDGWTNLWRDMSKLESKSEFLIVAPKGLDGNDEQSLVNWFGMWSLRHMDGVCLCYVLGSSYRGWEDMTRIIEPPRFVEGTVYCPTKAEDDFDSIEAIRNFDGEAAPMRLIENDSHDEIASYLGRFQYRSGSFKTAPFSYVSIFNRPVSYWNLDIGQALGDRTLKFSSYMEWFRFATSDTASHFNTHGALFYTIEDKWERQPLPLETTRRRPWIAFMRPHNPHRKPWEMTELLIWDPSYRAQFHGRTEILEVELLDAQKQLMKVVSENCRMPLTSVRVSWTNTLTLDGQASHLMDQCLAMLDACVKNTYEMLPAPEHALESKGWHLVKPYEPGQVAPQYQGGDLRGLTGRVASPEPMDIDSEPRKSDEQDGEDRLEEMRVVFHPPRSPLRQFGKSQTSMCKNLLVKYLQQQTARRGSGGHHHQSESSPVNYRFSPTMTWYEKQVKEGRDFKHIMVAPFEDVFQRLGIPRT